MKIFVGFFNGHSYAWMTREQANLHAHKQFISAHIFLGAMDWTILNSLKLTTYYLIFRFSRCLKEHCHRSFALFSFIRFWNLYLVHLLVPKMLKWTNRNISNEWWLGEQTIMNLWQYFQGMALKNLKKLASFFKFQSISILAMLSDR